jgi:uncharacterized OsmC-like protein
MENRAMDRNTQIRVAQEGIVAVYRNNPSSAFVSFRASGQVSEGLTCEFRQGDHKAVIDMPKIYGGDEKGPSPGFFIRAGLVGCVAIGIKATAIRERIVIDSIDVDVEMDFDDGAVLGVGSNSAAPLETRLTVTLQSSAPWDQVTAMVDRALAADPFFLALRDAQNVKSQVVRREA